MALDLSSVMHAGAHQFHPECRRGSLDGLQVCKLCSQVGLENDQHTHCTGDGISDQFESFAADGVFEIGKPGDVGARPCEVRDDTEFDRIGNLHEHDWQRAFLERH